jgi:tetratricopeptide (TPR) repeat protein
LLRGLGIVFCALARGTFVHSAALHAGDAKPVFAQAPSGQAAPQHPDEQAEAAKQQRERATRMNDLILQLNTATGKSNWQEAIAPLETLLGMDPANWQYRSALGDAHLHLGEYARAISDYEEGIRATEGNAADPSNSKGLAKNKAGISHMLSAEANAYLKLRQNDNAIAAYKRAMIVNPDDVTASFNLCATEYNLNNDEALQACEKAITLDPTKAVAYFIKGALLLADAKRGANGDILVPPGSIEAFTRCSQLAPNEPSGKDANDVLGLITSGNTSFAAEASVESMPDTPKILSGEAVARRVKNVDPSYSRLAKIAHVEGDVVFKAAIDAQGRIEHLQLKTGHVLLVKSAADAITQWQFKPYLLNGKPTTVTTTITIKFHM